MAGGGRSAAETACPFTEADVIGAWILPAPGSDVVEDDAREFAIERDGDARVFHEYLHHRPMGAGTWWFDEARCILTLDHGSLAETFRLVSAGEAQLVDESGQTYRRLPSGAEARSS
jgi:hypothetical protein